MGEKFLDYRFVTVFFLPFHTYPCWNFGVIASEILESGFGLKGIMLCSIGLKFKPIYYSAVNNNDKFGA